MSNHLNQPSFVIIRYSATLLIHKSLSPPQMPLTLLTVFNHARTLHTKPKPLYIWRKYPGLTLKDNSACLGWAQYKLCRSKLVNFRRIKGPKAVHITITMLYKQHISKIQNQKVQVSIHVCSTRITCTS